MTDPRKPGEPSFAKPAPEQTPAPATVDTPAPVEQAAPAKKPAKE